jgi:hypothetical protein
VAGALGEGPQITLLAIAALVIGADAAVDRDLFPIEPFPALGSLEPANTVLCTTGKLYQID